MARLRRVSLVPGLEKPHHSFLFFSFLLPPPPPKTSVTKVCWTKHLICLLPSRGVHRRDDLLHSARCLEACRGGVQGLDGCGCRVRNGWQHLGKGDAEVGLSVICRPLTLRNTTTRGPAAKPAGCSKDPAMTKSSRLRRVLAGRQVGAAQVTQHAPLDAHLGLQQRNAWFANISDHSCTYMVHLLKKPRKIDPGRGEEGTKRTPETGKKEKRLLNATWNYRPVCGISNALLPSKTFTPPWPPRPWARTSQSAPAAWAAWR